MAVFLLTVDQCDARQEIYQSTSVPYPPGTTGYVTKFHGHGASIFEGHHTMQLVSVLYLGKYEVLQNETIFSEIHSGWRVTGIHETSSPKGFASNCMHQSGLCSACSLWWLLRF
jgi:hypothetical protein